MIKMNIELTGVTEFESSLDRIRDVVSDFTPELRNISEWYIDFVTNDVFETEGGVYGDTWADLSEPYKSHKAGVYAKPPKPGVERKEYPGRGILEASGYMRTHWKLLTTSQYALIENKADYAIYHQEGTRKMPQRMLVKLDQERQDTINSMFRDSILQRIQDAVR